MTPDQWHAAVADLHALDAACPPDRRRPRLLHKLTAHVHAGRYDDAVRVGELVLAILPEPPAPRLQWCGALAWLVLVVTLLADLTIVAR